MSTATPHVGRAPRGTARTTCEQKPVLPAWPLLALLYGFPLYWVTGASLLAPTVLGGVMTILLILRGRSRATQGVLLWLAFLIWVGICVVSVTGLMQLLGYVQRTADLIAVGVALVYYVNARESISVRHILAGFAVIWFTVVGLGVLATNFPDVRITTPFAHVVPGSMLNNELVRELVQPRLAEVQQPWGAEEPFVRPAAPFPYTNSWGMAYAMLTPVMVLLVVRTRSRLLRVVLVLALLVSIYPAAQTSNRGMMIALAIFAVYVAARCAIAGRVLPALTVLAGLGTAGAFLQVAGVFDAIADRQEVSDTTSGRSGIYAATFDKVLESPFVGWATPGMDATIGIALGTQGYAWTLMYSYGFVGLFLFFAFLVRVFLATWRIPGPTAYVLQGLVFTVGATVWFYGLGMTQCLILVLTAGILSRAHADAEVLDDD